MSGKIEIVSVGRTANGNVSVALCVSDGENSERAEFVLLKRLFDGLDISVGEIDGALMSDIEYYSQVTRAYSSAYASFAYSPSSLRALKQKLVAKGFSRDVCNGAMELVESDGIIVESDVAVRRAEIYSQKLWGRRRILAKLREDGFSGGSVSDADGRLSEVDFEETCLRALQKKSPRGIPDDKKELDKLCAYLSRQGFSPTEIRAALKRYARI